MSLNKRSISDVDWLEPAQNGQKRQHTPSASEWIVHNEAFRNWDRDATAVPLLWLKGPPGCGKTFLVQHLIKRKHASTAVVFTGYFCDSYSTPAAIVRSLFAQMIRNPRFKPSDSAETAQAISNQDGIKCDIEGFVL
jgi:Cdc6-like AAA superfamily ATPase